jgi:cyanophycinase
MAPAFSHDLPGRPVSCREHHARSPDLAVTDGHVIIIGGAEDKVRDRVILSRFATLAGGRDATVVVISTASSLGVEAGERYKQVLGELGVTRVRAIHAVTRAQANDETAALALRDATGIFMTGGNQLRLSSTIGGTRLADSVLGQFRKGAVVAGTSAGASAMSSHMIAFGASGATPKHRMAQIAAGLGVLPGVGLGARAVDHGDRAAPDDLHHVVRPDDASRVLVDAETE